MSISPLRGILRLFQPSIGRGTALVIASALLSGAVYGYGFVENFSSTSSFLSNWQTNFRYGRSGVFFPSVNGTSGQAGRSSVSVVTNGQLGLVGAVQSHWEYAGAADDWTIGYWCGNTAKLTNAGGASHFTASPENPFGFTVLRTWARLDPDNEGYAGFNDSTACAVDAAVWLACDQGVSGTNNFEAFENAACLYEMYRYGLNTNALLGGYRSTWGYYTLAENRFSLGNVPFSTGNLDLVGNANYGLEWNFEDQSGVTLNSNCTNTNVIGIQMTHDGSTLSFFLNPNPLGNASNPYPNEYALLGRTAVSWRTNLRVMLGHGSHWHVTEMEDVFYDDLVIRSVSETGRFDLGPETVPAGSETAFALEIDPRFAEGNSGIGELEIRRPPGFVGAWKDVRVITDWGDGAADGVRAALVPSKQDRPGRREEFSQTSSGDSLRIRFCQKSDRENGVVGPGVPEGRIRVEFTLRAQENPVGPGRFTVLADCRGRSGESYTRVATTGAQALSAGKGGGIVRFEAKGRGIPKEGVLAGVVP